MSRVSSSAKSSFATSMFGADVKCQDCCILSDNKLFLVEFAGNHGFVFDPENCQWDTLEFDNSVNGVTVLQDKKSVILTEGSNGFQEMKLSNFHTKQQRKLGGNFKAVSALGNNILVHSDYCKLSIMDLTGEILNTINTKYDPWYVATDDLNCIYWTNGKHGEVHCEQIKGLKRFIYHNSKLQCPSGLAVDTHGSLYVAGYSSHNIHKLSRDGQYQGELLRENDGIRHPLGIAVNNATNELVVLNENGTSISIFKI